MSRDPHYDVLFEPIKIGPKTMRNRFYQTPHCSGLGVNFPGAQAAMRGMKAEGGWAVVNTEYCSIHPESDDTPWVNARLWDDSDVRNLALMAENVQRHGALAGVQLYYGGISGTNLETRTVARGPSQNAHQAVGRAQSCYAATKAEIRELQGFYVAAAKRALAAGFDIIIVGAEEVDNIALQFLMTRFNKRTDEYGGSFDNRARFLLETVEQVKEAVGDAAALSVRFCVDSLGGGPTGIRVAEEGVGFIAKADHLVDYWDLQTGGWDAGDWGEDAQSSRFSDENFQGSYIAQVRPHTNKPIVGVGRFTNPDTMVSVIRSGQQDIIGAARPSIADPFLPKKIEEGRLDDIRECIGCNICAGRFNMSGQIICTQNATMGEEYRRGWHPERFDTVADTERAVLIIGAGPAGMECATVLGRRGVEAVHLVDDRDRLGGALTWIPRLPGLGDWGRITDHRHIQIEKLPNVEFIANTRLTAEQVLDYGASIVVVATGAHWATDGTNGITHQPIPGVDAAAPNICTPEQIMAHGKAVPGEHVVVYDCDGYYMGVSMAEKLALDGKKVSLVTPHPTPAPFMGYTLEAASMTRRLVELGIAVYPSQVLSKFTDGEAIGASDYSAAPTRWQADALVLVTQRLSNDSLYQQLTIDQQALTDAGIEAVHRIGDCQVPRLIADCIFDGHRMGREIDTTSPRTPRPYRRENHVLTATNAVNLLAADIAGTPSRG